MSCPHCTLTEHTSGTLSWMQGEPFNPNGAPTSAHIEKRNARFFLVCEPNGTFPNEDNDIECVETQIKLCPWCGDKPHELPRFQEGELFIYVRDGDMTHFELGQVAKVLENNRYYAWYCVGNTTALTDVRNMRKITNAGFSHIERNKADATAN